MRTIEVSRLVRFAGVIAMIVTLGLGGCVVREHERTEKVVRYPVVADRRGAAPAWGPAPRWQRDVPHHRYGVRADDRRRNYGADGWRADRRPDNHGDRRRYVD